MTFEAASTFQRMHVSRSKPHPSVVCRGQLETVGWIDFVIILVSNWHVPRPAIRMIPMKLAREGELMVSAASKAVNEGQEDAIPRHPTTRCHVILHAKT